MVEQEKYDVSFMIIIIVCRAKLWRVSSMVRVL